MARYYIQAKRRNTNEKWSEWTQVDDFPSAVHHLKHVREVGYDSRLVPSEAVRRLWNILGKEQTELVDKILDAGFCLYEVTINKALYDLKRQVHNKAVYPHDENYSFINLNTFDAILQGYIKPTASGERNEQVSQ